MTKPTQNKHTKFFLFLALATFAPKTFSAETFVDASKRFLMANISPADGVPGSVIAAPSRANPDYYYHWIRDAALTMEAIRQLLETTKSPFEHERYAKILWDYAQFSRQNQLTSNQSGPALKTGIGEPKFYVDGSAYWGDWGRPQSDGPALRALVLTRFAKSLLNHGAPDQAQKLYRPVYPADSIIKQDLEYISHNWMGASYDLWEEFKGDHFYTRMVQHRALLEGADLSDLLGDPQAASWYRSQADLIQQSLESFWDSNAGYLVTMRNWAGGTNPSVKQDGLDSGVVLAVLHAQGNDDFLNVDDPKVLATVDALISVFDKKYAINKVTIDRDGNLMAPAIGRYEKDKYNGYDSRGQGNPWFLITSGFGEIHFRMARLLNLRRKLAINSTNQTFYTNLLTSTGHISLLNKLMRSDFQGSDADVLTEMTAALRERGDQFLNRVRYHAASTGSMSEQINQNTGIMQGANDLTWSYASYLTAVGSR